MYGTVARLRTKPGMAEQLERLSADYEAVAVDGHIANYLYRLDGTSDDFYLVVLFRDRESYHRNANDPAQNERYLRMRELLAEDPRWHDGEVVQAFSRA